MGEIEGNGWLEGKLPIKDGAKACRILVFSSTFGDTEERLGREVLEYLKIKGTPAPAAWAGVDYATRLKIPDRALVEASPDGEEGGESRIGLGYF